MLRTLIIKNYALISELEIRFADGFSVITGETGAGKSIILGALSLILGNRADSKSVKEGESRCFIEGIFDISAYNLKPFFEEKGIDWEAECILRREIWSSGKSRAFINDNPVALNDLKELSGYLIEIHSQHDTLKLPDHRFQLEIVDTYARNQALRNSYTEAFLHYRAICERCEELKYDARQNAAQEEFLRFQFAELDEAKLQPEEQEELEQEREILSHAEEIKGGLYRIHQILDQEEGGAINALRDALSSAQSLHKIYPGADEIHSRIETAFLDMKDLAGETSRKQDQLDFNPSRMEEVQSRLDLIYRLHQKYKTDTVSQLIALRDEIAGRIQIIDHYDEAIANLERQAAEAHQSLLDQAARLTASRHQAAGELSKALVERVSQLGMPNMQLRIDLAAKNTPESDGCDAVDFLFASTGGLTPRPISQIASGGELSRLMLGVRVVVGGIKALPTIIFDEIDTGVSGEMAARMAFIMHEMSRTMQVVAITHLPQIAARGDHHYYVYKEDHPDGARTHIRLLDFGERTEAVAHMLSGDQPTPAAIETARQLLEANLQ